jgi:hypothetical protein
MIARVLAFTVLVTSAAFSAVEAKTPPNVALPPPTAAFVAQQQPPVVQPPPGPPRTIEPPARPPAVQVQPAPRREGQPFNVKVDVTISEQTGTAPPLRKTVTVVAGEGTPGFVRSQATFGGIPNPLNVDVEPVVSADGKIRLGLGIQYDVPAPPVVVDSSTGRGPDPQTVRSALGNLTRTEIRQNLRVVLESGKPLVVSQSADPVGDRKVTLEVTATILK